MYRNTIFCIKRETFLADVGSSIIYNMKWTREAFEKNEGRGIKWLHKPWYKTQHKAAAQSPVSS